MFSVVCAHVITDGNENAVQAIIDTVSNDAEKLVLHLFEWVKTAQVISCHNFS
jgi:hypothetical protein